MAYAESRVKVKVSLKGQGYNLNKKNWTSGIRWSRAQWRHVTIKARSRPYIFVINLRNKRLHWLDKQESSADADKPAGLKRIQNCSNSTCFVSFHRIPFPQIANMHSFTRYVQSGSRPILSYTVWNPVFANYKVSCLNYKYLVYRLFS